MFHLYLLVAKIMINSRYTAFIMLKFVKLA